MFGIATPTAAVILFKEAITQQWVILEDTVLLDFFEGFTPAKMNNIIIISAVCLLGFGSIAYCIDLGYQRHLMTKNQSQNLIALVVTLGIATALMLIATLALSELQISIFTGWLSLIALIVSFTKLSLNSNRNCVEDDRNDEQGTKHTIEK